MKVNTFTKKMQELKIEPCKSNTTGKPVKNQYIISLPGFYAFQSYDSLIAVYDVDNQDLILGRDWDYSITTLKYLYQYVEYYCYSIYRQLPNGKSKKDSFQKAIDNGLIKYNAEMV